MKSIIAQELERLGASSPVVFEVTFADGETYRNRPGIPSFCLRFHSRAVEWGIAAFGHIGMCDAYFDGELDVEGDLRAAFRAGMGSGFDSANVLVDQRNRWHELRHSESRGQSCSNTGRFVESAPYVSDYTFEQSTIVRSASARPII